MAPIRTVNRLGLQPAKNFAWVDGHWAIYSTHQVHLGCQRCVLSTKNALATQLTELPRPPSCTKGERGRKSWEEGKGRGGKEIGG